MNTLLLAASLVEIRPALILYTLLTFFIVALILRWKAWGPILSLAEEREKQITNAVESAKKERAEAEKLLAEQRAAVAEARREAAEMMRKNQADVEKFRDELMSKAKAEAEAAKADAQRAIQEERQKAITDIRGQAADLAVDIAKKILGTELDAQKHKALAEQYVASLPKTLDGTPRA
jgi:F-type H+-transporting ATPase subunit b